MLKSKPTQTLLLYWNFGESQLNNEAALTLLGLWKVPAFRPAGVGPFNKLINGSIEWFLNDRTVAKPLQEMFKCWYIGAKLLCQLWMSLWHQSRTFNRCCITWIRRAAWTSFEWDIKVCNCHLCLCSVGWIQSASRLDLRNTKYEWDIFFCNVTFSCQIQHHTSEDKDRQ